MLGLLSLGPGGTNRHWEAFWESGFVLNGCKIEFPCKLIDLMQTSNYKSFIGENFWA